jgi:hypothetical protein
MKSYFSASIFLPFLFFLPSLYFYASPCFCRWASKRSMVASKSSQ